MPIYEYRCRKGHTFDVMQRISDEPVTVCEVCGAQVERVFHPIAVHFKGSGFYNTDYGTRKRSREMKEAKENGKPASSESGGGTDSGSGSESKSSDSKGTAAAGSAAGSDAAAKKSPAKT